MEKSYYIGDKLFDYLEKMLAEITANHTKTVEVINHIREALLNNDGKDPEKVAADLNGSVDYYYELQRQRKALQRRYKFQRFLISVMIRLKKLGIKVFAN